MDKYIDGVKVTQCPKGPENVHFQEYQHDQYLGEPPNLHRATPEAEDINGEAKTLSRLMKISLGEALERLKRRGGEDVNE